MFSSPSTPFSVRSPLRLAKTAAWLALGVAVISASACDQGQNARVQADVHDAASQAAAGLNQAAVTTKNAVDDTVADAKPAVDRVAKDAKRSVDTLAVTEGKATEKAGETLQRAGERHRADAESQQTPAN